MSSLRLFTLAALLAACPFALAQYTAGKIIFKNPGTYAQSDLEAVAGIHAQDKVSGSVVQAAAQRLIDTGYFDDVGASLEGPAAAINVTFTLKPLEPAQMPRAGFENFVWFSPQELQAVLHKAAPLFKDRLPAAGDQTEAIGSALQAALAAKGVTATVVHDQVEPNLQQPFRVVEYRVKEPAVVTHAVKLQGVSPEMATQMQKAVQAIQLRDYNEGFASPTTAERLLAPYADAGYLDAKLVATDRTVAETTSSAISVDVSATVDAGTPYRVAGFSFAGTPLIAGDAVVKAAKLHDSDIASRQLLLDTVAPIDTVYRRQGYTDVLIDTGAQLNGASHTVSYTVTVTPGEQYRVRTVSITGLSVAARASFDRDWHMAPGELYDSGNVTEFLVHSIAQPAMRSYSATFEASIDHQVRLVDLTLRFIRANQ